MNRTATTLLGWRIWTLDATEGSEMRSPFVADRHGTQRGTPWPTASMVATCRRPHKSPAPSCGCGLYADPDPYRSIALRRAEMLTAQLRPHNLRVILGRVELTGTVLLDRITTTPRSQSGLWEYRAEHVKITALWCLQNLHTTTPGLTRELRARYGVPVSTDLPKQPSQHQPQPIPDHLAVGRLRGPIQTTHPSAKEA